MLKELSAIASMMKQAQGMSGKVEEMKDRMAHLRCEGQAGDGAVVVEVTGQMQVLSCRIDPALMLSGDRARLEELVCSAMNEALEKVRQVQVNSMQQLSAGVNIPGLGDALAGMGLGQT